jgi:hypothetical protein
LAPDFLDNPRTPIERAFVEFHRKNPHVYNELERLALLLWNKRHPSRMGVKMLWETMRYNVALRTEGDEYKLNNNFHSLYARLLIRQQPHLEGVIELRERRA